MKNLSSREFPQSVTIRGEIGLISLFLTRDSAVGHCFSSSIAISGRTLGMKCNQSPLGDQQIIDSA
jgi:hypothetical protein